MAISLRNAFLPLVIVILAASFVFPVRPASAEDALDGLVLGNITPAVAGQRVGISVNGVACTIAEGTGITNAAGSYGLVTKNCQGGRATLTVGGVATSTQFDFTPGKTHSGINSGPSTGFKGFALMVARD